MRLCSRSRCNGECGWMRVGVCAVGCSLKMRSADVSVRVELCTVKQGMDV